MLKNVSSFSKWAKNGHPPGEELSPDVKPEPFLLQLCAVSFHSVIPESEEISA